MFIQDDGLDMSVEAAMKTLERLKVVHIVVEKFPEVDSEEFI